MPAWIKNFSTWLRRTIGGMVTEHDNQTHDLVKHGGWIGLFSVVTSHFYQLYQSVHGVANVGVPTVKDLAFAVTAVLAGCGVGVAVKRSSEHDDPKDDGGAQ
jgi:hypothetical protein